MVVLGEAEHKGKDKRRALLCRCDCGTEKVVTLKSLRNKSTQSCGCLCRERAQKKFSIFVDGVNSDNHPLYRTWLRMRARCHNTNDADFHLYGARGIQVCQEWQDSFAQFVADMGPRPDGYSIDRVDNDGPYSPENCRWADKYTQSRNRRTTVNITYLGETCCMAVWSAKLGGCPTLVKSRIQKGWSPIEAVSTPLGETPTTINDCI